MATRPMQSQRNVNQRINLASNAQCLTSESRNGRKYLSTTAALNLND
ncbi:hypothetical protein [[Leptolyngbya] sp. PCC 7376]|nr:hypothetical protein [[Leptolyngbya] sp. PCC 7376]